MYLQQGATPNWWDELSDYEQTFFRQVADLHADLGLDPEDMRPANFGVDSDGLLVLLDIYTGQ